MNNYGAELETMLGEAILDLAGQLENADLKLADFVRLAQLEEELEHATMTRLITGWVDECRNSSRNTER